MNELLSIRRRMTEMKPYTSRIEYLESSGTQYIDTGIVLQENDIVEIEAMFLEKSGDNNIMGCSGLTGEGGLWVDTYNNTTHYVRFGSSSSASQNGNAVNNINVWRTYRIEKNKFYVDSVQILTPNFSSMPSRTTFFFGRNGYQTNYVGRIKSIKILREGTPILDLKSVRNGNIGYMYDQVTGTLFGNSGTGDFILGPDI